MRECVLGQVQHLTYNKKTMAINAWGGGAIGSSHIQSAKKTWLKGADPSDKQEMRKVEDPLQIFSTC